MARRKRSRFQYQENDPTITDEHSQGRGDFDDPIKAGVVKFKPKDGRNRIRIFPRTWEKGPRHWNYEVWVHYGVGADNATYICPLKQIQEPCPMCEDRADILMDAQKTKSAKERKELEQAAKDLRPRRRCACYVLDENSDEGRMKGPQAWFMPTKLEQQICGLSKDEDTGEVVRIDHPETGRAIFFTKQGSGKQTEYTAPKVGVKPLPLSEDEEEMDEWLDFIVENPVPSFLNIYDYDYLSSVYGGATSSAKQDDDVEDEDEDEEPAPPRSRRSGRARISYDEDEEEVEEQEDDEPPPRTSRSSTTRRRRIIEEEEEDEEEVDDDVALEDIDAPEDEDEEEEERPPRRSAGRSGSSTRRSARSRGDLRATVRGGLRRKKR